MGVKHKRPQPSGCRAHSPNRPLSWANTASPPRAPTPCPALHGKRRRIGAGCPQRKRRLESVGRVLLVDQHVSVRLQHLTNLAAAAQPNNDRSAPISASLTRAQGLLIAASGGVGRTLTSRRIVTSLYSTATKTSHVRANNASPSDQSVFVRVNKRIASARTPFAGAGCRLLVAGARRAASFDGGTRLGKGGVMALAQPCAQNRCTV